MNGFLIKCIFAVIFLRVFWNYFRASASNPVQVTGYVNLKSQFGNLLGTVEAVKIGQNIQHFTAYRGIPYAEAPNGTLRWQDPIVKRPLPDNVVYYDATKSRSQCPQWIRQDNGSRLIGNEDCLYADIYIPKLQHEQPHKKLLKIMIFFHGGGFIVNSNKDMMPIPLLHYAEEPVLVIIFNYRISIFGYLSTGTKELPGNYGSLDQIALLKWIKLYGRDFGGDPNDVTLFGSSIGGVSIHYILLSNLGTGLYHKVIMESGSALCERSMVPNPLDIAIKLGSHVGCLTSDPIALSACLRSKSTVDLMNAGYLLTNQWVLPSVLGPVIDKYSRPLASQFLSDHPEHLPIVSRIPVVVGLTSDEGLTAFVRLSQGYSLQQLTNLEYIKNHILPHYLDLIMRVRKNHSERNTFIAGLSNEVMQVYEEKFRQDPIKTLVGILGDLWINMCHRKTVESLCSYNVPVVYSYLFTHRDPGVSPSEINKVIEDFHRAGINHPILDFGVGHTEEILYMLNKEDELDKFNFWRNAQMSKMLSGFWTRFAYSRNLVDADGSFEWKPVCTSNYTNPRFPLQEISLNSQRLFPDFRIREIQVWWRIHKDTISLM